jgi:hypothetical protein
MRIGRTITVTVRRLVMDMVVNIILLKGNIEIFSLPPNTEHLRCLPSLLYYRYYELKKSTHIHEKGAPRQKILK